jgi:prepilin-type N-terminal cleavage/methylation domain-containing protein
MQPGSRSRRGFTLIELLVVVAILSVLVAVLMPTLGKVREVARFTLCRANLRNVSNAFHGFAVEHDGRFPGAAFSTIEIHTTCWYEILNREFYGRNQPSCYPNDYLEDSPCRGPIVRYWTFWLPDIYKEEDLRKKYVTCPSYGPWGDPTGASNIWSRAWIMNQYAAGGGYSAPANGGKEIVPATNVHPNYYEYYLGTRYEVFKNPSEKYLIWDSERNNDYSSGGTSGAVTMGDSGSYPPWSAQTGYWAFRHLRPTDPRLYQVSARGCVLYADGHAGELNPNASIASPSRVRASP